jgi:hypothetical protein
MSLWVVSAIGAIDWEEPDFADMGGQFVAAHRAGGAVKMLVEGDEAMVRHLRRLPNVLSVGPAHDGEFADDTDGPVLVRGSATSWERLPMRRRV